MEVDPSQWQPEPVGVLCSGGLDSAILVGELSQLAPRVVPIYMRFGLYWEQVEEASLRRFLAALDSEVVLPLRVFEMPLKSVYGEHWSTTGQNVPDANSADEAVFLPGRNLLLLAQPALWCHLNGIDLLALAPLATNPFPDADATFFRLLEETINHAVVGRLKFWRPYGKLHKLDVMKRGKNLPLELTFSCIRPDDGRHCGVCNKCAERIHAFANAEIPDKTEYASAS